MPPWDPLVDPWPGTPGGASAPSWGGYVRLWIRAALEAGDTFHLGAHPNDKLDAGNVLGGSVAARDAVGVTSIDRLWHDITCDVLDVEIAGGTSSAQGIFSKADAATCVVTLADPTGIYDPLNTQSPFQYGGHSRLTPGVPVEAFAEVVNGDTGAVTRHKLFTGTADSWGEDWVPRPYGRKAKMSATDATKLFVRMDRPDQPQVGAGDTTRQRVQRIVDFFGWTGPIEHAASSAVTEAPTTLGEAAWEMLNRAIDDEIGYCYFTNTGALRWTDRASWATVPAPVLALGCDDLGPYHDVLVDASPSNMDVQIRNSVYAAREGGISQHAVSGASIQRFGEYGYERTDLGVQYDAQAAEWATVVVQLYAFPQVALDDVTAVPAIDARSWEVWPAIFDLRYVTDLVRVVWAPPDFPDRVIDVKCRVVGTQHKITRAHWEITLSLVAAQPLQLAGMIFTLGPHARDRLNAGFVLG